MMPDMVATKGRADGPTGPYEVTVVVGVFYQFMGDVIEDAETVAEDGCEFFFQPIFDDLRKRRAVDFMSLFVAHVLQGFRRAGDLREVQRFLRDRPQSSIMSLILWVYALLCRLRE